MHKINTSGATADFRFKETPAPATRLSAEYLNMIQDELAKVVTDPAGGNEALDPNDNGQLLQAIIAIVDRAVGARAAAQKGIYSSNIIAGNLYSVVFPVAFPAGRTVLVQLTPISTNGSARRDNWLQLQGSSETGFTVVVQGSRTGGDDSLDGFFWSAEAL